MAVGSSAPAAYLSGAIAAPRVKQLFCAALAARVASSTLSSSSQTCPHDTRGFPSPTFLQYVIPKVTAKMSTMSPKAAPPAAATPTMDWRMSVAVGPRMMPNPMLARRPYTTPTPADE